ncbi:DUF2905 domain-containing protein [Paenalkalicoccus suaedae]|uniref:DUF2905 domain-containing protein n=1 Tax=Paenalkalicoccus suaedae TaxID=2592382 RepID=A0A859FCH5_9BACI|nr:DUF2905 domain-containing protein [Paenalkalicoccus suaedae]QKS70767.1 DUF2905 domain-containing protein [Paenalkalicoccus suaedae]
MESIPKLLIWSGLTLLVVGLLWQFLSRFISLGRLPFDIVIERGNTTFYFPIMTSIILSVVLSLIIYLVNR